MRSDHQLHEMRSLRMHRLVAERYQAAPADVIRFGLDNLKRWRQRGVDCDDFAVWKNLLLENPDKLNAILTGIDQEAIRLRQSSPFAGLVPEADRRRILTSTEWMGLVDDQTGTIGWCLEKHDLAFSKLAAGRAKDIGFVRELLKHRLVNRGKILRLIESVKSEELKQLLLRNWTIVTARPTP